MSFRESRLLTTLKADKCLLVKEFSRGCEPKSPTVSRSLAAERTTGLSAKLGPTAILFPLRAVSASDREGQPFDDSVARMALLDALRSNRAGVPLVELDYHINDPEFADAAAHRLLELLRQASTPSSLQAST